MPAIMGKKTLLDLLYARQDRDVYRSPQTGRWYYTNSAGDNRYIDPQLIDRMVMDGELQPSIVGATDTFTVWGTIDPEATRELHKRGVRGPAYSELPIKRKCAR